MSISFKSGLTTHFAIIFFVYKAASKSRLDTPLLLEAFFIIQSVCSNSLSFAESALSSHSNGLPSSSTNLLLTTNFIFSTFLGFKNPFNVPIFLPPIISCFYYCCYCCCYYCLLKILSKQ